MGPLLGAALGFMAALPLVAAPAPESVLFSYDRARDGAMNEAAALRAYATASNVFEQASEYPVDVSAAPQRLAWAAPPSLLVLERTLGPNGRILALRAFTEPLRAVPPSPPAVQDRSAPVVLDVLLLRQTTQGTCAPITVASLLLFYGLPFPPNVLIDSMKVTAEKGANVQELLAFVQTSFLNGTGLSIREHFGFDTDRFLQLLTTYNREAKKRTGTPPLFWKPPDIQLDRAFSRAQPALLKEVANKLPGRDRFWREVKHSIDDGHPLLWGVLLGLMEEPNLATPQPVTGHLRLIVGYRESPRAILFSDPWGPGHSAKELSLEDAWTETLTLHSFRVAR